MTRSGFSSPAACELLLRLQPDHGLVEQHVVEHRSQRVVGVLAAGGIPDRVADRHAQRARAVRLVDRRRHHLATPGLDHHPTVRLLVVRGPHHVDLAGEAEEGAREGQRAPPLTGAGLGGDPLNPLLAVVVRLGDGGVGLVRPGGRDRLVLVVDAGRGVERLLEAAGPHQGSRTPEPEDVEHLTGDVDPRVGRDLLEDQRHREEGGQVLRARGLAGAGVQRRLDGLRKARHDIEPGFGQALGWHGPAHGSSPTIRRTVVGDSSGVPGGRCHRRSPAVAGWSPASTGRWGGVVPEVGAGRRGRRHRDRHGSSSAAGGSR